MWRRLPVEFHGGIDGPSAVSCHIASAQHELPGAAWLLSRAGAFETEIQAAGERLFGRRHELPVRAADRDRVLPLSVS